MEKKTYLLVYNQYARKLNNDLRHWLEDNVDAWRYNVDYNQHERLVWVSLTNSQVESLKANSFRDNGSLQILSHI